MGVVVLGLMSGTSLDGLDLALVEFFESHQKIGWKILKTETVSYNTELANKLERSPTLSGLDLRALDVAYGRWLGETAMQFIEGSSFKPEVIASHGHTVFHEPKQGFTHQIGDGNYIAAGTGIDCIYDFRSLDMAVGGQGAPLVPIGDALLFSEFTHCINLGGIANVSFEKNGNRMAFDICPFNLLLNHYSQIEGHPYDAGGALAKTGDVHKGLLDALNAHAYFNQQAPKSLDKTWLMNEFIPLVNEYQLPTKDILKTLIEHFVIQISGSISDGSVLITGGGAKNDFFIERLRSFHPDLNPVPNEELVDFKEALIFALLGYLRLKNLNNTVPEATGGQKAVCAGTFIKAPEK